MSQQTYTAGGIQVAEPPAPVLPAGESGPGDENRRKLMIVGAAVGVLVLGIVVFFLLKGGGSSNSSDTALAIPHHRHHAAAPAAARPPVVKLPKQVAAPVGRDPFKPLYVASATGSGSGGTATSTAPGGSVSSSSTGTSPTTTSSGTSTTTSGGTTTTPTATYHPVWVKLKAITATTATFDVGYSNNKSLKVVHYSGIKPLHTFASNFELLSVRNGTASVRYGDGSPFSLTLAHPTMIVG